MLWIATLFSNLENCESTLATNPTQQLRKRYGFPEQTENEICLTLVNMQDDQ